MCNLYTLSNSQTELADFFDAIAQDFGANSAEEVYPGYPSLVVTEAPEGRQLRSMIWGFPFQRKGAKGQPLKPRPVNNARTDKLKSFFWRDSFENRRCLIPVTRFAEAEGEKGRMTRTWFSMPGAPVFAVAGIWRTSDEWGEASSMIMTDANEQVAPVHDRMPVILERETWADWFGGTPHQAFDLCVPFAGKLAMSRTDDPWARRRAG